MTDLSVDARDVVVEYGRHRAVRGVTLGVEAGEFYTLLGTNGAGKTSLLETLEGLRRPQQGVVSVLGTNPADRRVRSRLGIMLQDSGFAPDLTTKETIGLLGRLSGRVDQPEQVLKRVGLGAKQDVRVGQLSGGERRRLDLATAVFGSPELLILDEPSTGLDPESRDRMWAVIESLRQRGSTIIHTTHYLEEAEAHSDRIGIMHDGLLRAEGTLEDMVADHPARIRFRIAPDLVPGLPIPVYWDRDVAIVETYRLQADLLTILGWAKDANVSLLGLTATPSTLRDLFREVTSGGGDA